MCSWTQKAAAKVISDSFSDLLDKVLDVTEETDNVRTVKDLRLHSSTFRATLSTKWRHCYTVMRSQEHAREWKETRKKSLCFPVPWLMVSWSSSHCMSTDSGHPSAPPPPMSKKAQQAHERWTLLKQDHFLGQHLHPSCVFPPTKAWHQHSW